MDNNKCSFIISNFIIKMTYQIVKATVNDIQLINNLGNIIFRETYTHLLSQQQIEYMLDMMYSEESLKRQILEDKHTYFILYLAENQDDILVPAGYFSVQEEAGSTFHLQKLYISHKHRGLGLGKIMLKSACEFVLTFNKPSSRLILNVNRYNTKAVEFYKHLGFEIIYTGDFDIGEGYLMTDYIMSLNIN